MKGPLEFIVFEITCVTHSSWVSGGICVTFRGPLHMQLVGIFNKCRVKVLLYLYRGGNEPRRGFLPK